MRELFSRFVLAVTDLEDLLQHHDVEDVKDLATAATDRQGTAEALETDEESNQGADAGAGDDVDVGEVEDEESCVFADAGGNVVPKLGRTVDLEVAGEAHDETFSDLRVGLVAELHEGLTVLLFIDLLCGFYHLLPATHPADEIRLWLELSIRAKGILLARQSGFVVPPDPDMEGRFAELKFLEHSIGRTGLLAMSPLFHFSDRDQWQYHMIGKR